MAYKILLFMKRKPGMSMDAFRDYYENHHVPLCLKYTAGLSRYSRRYLEPQPHAETGANEELPYDVITELWFYDEAVFRATVKHLSTTVMTGEIIEDELQLFDRSKSRMATVLECETTMPVAEPD